MFIIPSKENKVFSQPNTGEVQGNLWASFNIDLTRNKGRALTTRALDVVDSLDIGFTTMKTPIAFAYYELGGGFGVGKKFIAYAGKTWYGSGRPDSGWTTSTTANEPDVTTNTQDVDMKVFNNKLYATTNNSAGHKLKRIATGGGWTDIISIGTGITPNLHILETYANRLYWTQDNTKVFSLDTSEVTAVSGSYSLVLSGRNGHISWMRAGSNRIWIGFTSSDGSGGSIFEWDGVSENFYNKEYKIESQGSCTCVVKNDIPYVLDADGRLLAFNGSNFQEIGRLPVANAGYPLYNYIQNSGQKLAHFNGSYLLNDKILFLVDPQIARGQRYLENCPPGIWEFSPQNGFFHRMAVSSTKIDEATPYDYGQEYLLFTGAIFGGFQVDSTFYYPSNRQGAIVFGARTYRTTTSSPYLIGVDNTLDDVQKSAYIVTQWLESSQVTDVWNAIVTKYRRLLNDTDEIKLKYRTVKEDYVEMDFQWASTTTFTTNNTELAEFSVGDEIEVNLGAGSGKVVTITDIDYVNPTYTVTIDEAVPGASGTSYGKFQKWRELKKITKDSFQFATRQLPQFNKDVQCQFKIIMQWTGANELYEAMVVDNTEQYAQANKK